MKDNNLSAISNVLRKVSRKDVEAFGGDPRGTGWRDGREQETKFEAIVSTIVDHVYLDDEVSILDVGCGNAAFYRYLLTCIRDVKIDYYGIDLVQDSVDLAIRYRPELKDKVIVGDILTHDFYRQFDIVISNGLFHWKGDLSADDFETYMFRSLRKQWELCREALVFNLITPAPSYRNPDQFYIPSLDRLFGFLYAKTRKVVIHSDFAAWDITVCAVKYGEKSE